jgi:hypothetical protein
MNWPFAGPKRAVGRLEGPPILFTKNAGNLPTPSILPDRQNPHSEGVSCRYSHFGKRPANSSIVLGFSSPPKIGERVF